MNAHKVGFTLIELLVAIAISVMLSTILVGVFWQINRSVARARSRMDLYSNIMLVSHQLQKDISGAFIPLERLIEDQKKEKPATKKEAPPEQAEAQKPQEKTDTEAKEKKKRKPLTKIFYATNKNDMLSLLTCITNNPVHAYWGARAGKPTPLIVRVVYRLEASEGQEDSFALYRQESSVLDFDSFDSPDSSIRKYKVIDGIKAMRGTFLTHVESKEEGAEKPTQKEKVTQNWDVEQKKEEKERPKHPLVPEKVDLTLTLWDNKKEREYTVEITIPIIPDFYFEWIKKEQSAEQKKRPAQPVPGQQLPAGIPAPPLRAK